MRPTLRACARISALVLLGLIALGVFVLHSNAQVVAEDEIDCENAVTTLDMVGCAQRRHDAADARLNALYQKGLKDYDAEGAKILRDSQRSWISFRDLECLRYRDMARGGTMAPLLEIGCLADMTEQRIAELENTTEGLAGSPDSVFWQSAAPIVERFDCQNWLRARVGLLPTLDEKGASHLSVRVEVGDRHLDFPVSQNSQMGVCAPTVTLSVEAQKGGCPGLKLDDGGCDAIHLSWDKKRDGLNWSRN